MTGELLPGSLLVQLMMLGTSSPRLAGMTLSIEAIDFTGTRFNRVIKDSETLLGLYSPWLFYLVSMGVTEHCA